MSQPSTKPRIPNFSSGPCAKRPGYDVAQLDLSALGRSHRSALGKKLLGACCTETARILGLQGYGIAPGCKADLVWLDAGSPVEAIRLRAARRLVMRRGQVVSEAPPMRASLQLPGRPESVDFRLTRKE